MSVGRLNTLLLILALVLGLMVHAVGGATAQSAPATVTDVAVPDGCKGCGNIGHGTSAVCATLCNGAPVVPSSIATVEIGVSMLPAIVASLAGRHGPPDPYPPRSIELS
jgi:hypothetical protein